MRRGNALRKSGTLVEKLISFFRPAEPGASHAAHKSNRHLGQTSATTQYKVSDAFRETLLSALTNKEVLLSGRVRLIELSNFNALLEDSDTEFLSKLRDIVETSIEEHLGNDEGWARYRDDYYLVLFSTGSPADAKRRARKIAQTISRRVMKAFRNDVIDALTEVVELPGEKISALYKETKSGNAAAKPPSPRNTAIQLEADKTIPDAPDSSAWRIDPFRDAGAELLYYPLWDTKLQTISSLICYPVPARFDGNGDTFAQYLAYGRTSHVGDLAELDCYVLETVTETMECMVARDPEYRVPRFYCAIPVHVSTLLAQAQRARFLKLCEELPSSLKDFTGFLILNSADGIPLSTINPNAVALRQFGRDLIVYEDIAARDLRDYRNTSISTVVTKTNPAYSDEMNIELLRSFAKTGGRSRLYTCVLGIDSKSVALEALLCGYNFVGGAFVHKPDLSIINIAREPETNLLLS